MRRRDELHEKGVRVRFIGRRDWRVPRRVLRRMDETVELTRDNRRLTLTLAFNYGGPGRDHRRGPGDGAPTGRPADKVTEKRLRQHLYAPDMPDPDLVVRTSGEYRISNFLLWELAYSELRLHRRAVARLPSRAPVRRGARVPAPRPPLRGCEGGGRNGVGRPMALYHDRGVVLRTYKLGEADRIVSILTRGHGKVRAVAKGVRKTKSRFGGRLEPVSHVDLLLYEGRGELDIVIAGRDRRRASGPPRRPRPAGPGDRRCSRPPISSPSSARPTPGSTRCCVGALRTLADRDAPLVVPGFLLKALALEGYRPQVEACVACGIEEPLVSWAMEEGGLRCTAHRQGPAISPEAVTVLQDMLGRAAGGGARARPRPPVVSEVDHLVVRTFEHHVERRLRSVGTFDRS